MVLPAQPNQPLSDAQARQRNNRDAAGRWTETERMEPESVQLAHQEKQLPPIDEVTTRSVEVAQVHVRNPQRKEFPVPT